MSNTFFRKFCLAIFRGGILLSATAFFSLYHPKPWPWQENFLWYLFIYWFVFCITNLEHLLDQTFFYAEISDSVLQHAWTPYSDASRSQRMKYIMSFFSPYALFQHYIYIIYEIIISNLDFFWFIFSWCFPSLQFYLLVFMCILL